jgi:hypothetical protein
MSTPAQFGTLDGATVAALLLELAAQLHIERARRLALETALADRGILAPAQTAAAAETLACRDALARAADESVRRLLRILSESADDKVPLRAEAPRAEGESA